MMYSFWFQAQYDKLRLYANVLSHTKTKSDLQVREKRSADNRGLFTLIWAFSTAAKVG